MFLRNIDESHAKLRHKLEEELSHRKQTYLLYLFLHTLFTHFLVEMLFSWKNWKDTTVALLPFSKNSLLINNLKVHGRQFIHITQIIPFFLVCCLRLFESHRETPLFQIERTNPQVRFLWKSTELAFGQIGQSLRSHWQLGGIGESLAFRTVPMYFVKSQEEEESILLGHEGLVRWERVLAYFGRCQSEINLSKKTRWGGTHWKRKRFEIQTVFLNTHLGKSVLKNLLQ